MNSAFLGISSDIVVLQHCRMCWHWNHSTFALPEPVNVTVWMGLQGVFILNLANHSISPITIFVNRIWCFFVQEKRAPSVDYFNDISCQFNNLSSHGSHGGELQCSIEHIVHLRQCNIFNTDWQEVGFSLVFLTALKHGASPYLIPKSERQTIMGLLQKKGKRALHDASQDKLIYWTLW